MRNLFLRKLKRYFRQNFLSTVNESTTGVSRREFIKYSAGSLLGAGYLLFGQESSGAQRLKQVKNTGTKVTIIGAGLAGLTAAYSLNKKGIACELYEASTRTGGRVYTHHRFNNDGQFCELGGELIDTNHTKLIHLAKELGLRLERLDLNDDDLEPELYFIDNQLYDGNDVRQAFKPLAKIISRDLKQIFGDDEPDYFIAGQANLPYQQFDRLTLTHYLDRASVEVDTWLLKMIESAYVSEFGLSLEEQSALNLILTIGIDDNVFEMYGESDEAFRIKGGNSQLIYALKKKITAPIHYHHQLIKISDTGQKLKLTFGANDRKTVVVDSDIVILALPFSVLKYVQGVDCLGLSPSKIDAIQNLGYGTNSKQMLGFNTRFWRDQEQVENVSTGVIYSNLPFQNTWDTSRLQAGKSGVLTNFCGGTQGALLSRANQQEFIENLKQIYGHSVVETQALMGDYQLMNWTKYRHAQGSYSCFKPGQYSSMYGLMGTPELGGRLLFAGEHTAWEFPSFMCGAVESGLTAAQQVIL